MSFPEEINLFQHIWRLVKRGQFVFYLSFLEKLIYFIIFVLLARRYSTTEYGLFISVFALGNILVASSELGFANYFQRETASGRDNLSEEFNSVFSFRLITFFIILLFAFLYFSSEPAGLTLVVIIIAAIFVFNSSWIIIKIFYGLNQYHSVFNRFLISRGILIVSAIILLALNVSLTLLSISFLLSAISEFLLFIFKLIKENIVKFRVDLKTNILKKILVSSIPMGMSAFFVMVYDRIDVLLIQKIISLEAVSFYAIAYSLYKIPSIFIPIVLTPLFTDLSSEFEKNKKIDLSILKNLSLLLLILSVCSIITIYFLADVLIGLTYGDKYLSSTNLLILLVFALPFLFLNNLTGVILNSIKKEKVAFYSAVIAAIFNILINVLLLNFVGIEGAVVSTIITEILILLIQFNYLLKFKMNFFSNIQNQNE